MRAINPPGYSVPGISQAMLVPNNSSLLVLSGHAALGPEGVIGTDLAGQLDQIFKSLQATLQEAGTDFRNVARFTIYVRNYDSTMLPTIRAVRERYVNFQLESIGQDRAQCSMLQRCHKMR